jgi:hypothetical protein
LTLLWLSKNERYFVPALKFLIKDKCLIQSLWSTVMTEQLNIYVCWYLCRSQWPHDLRRRSTAARLLRSCVRILPAAWMSVCCERFVLSGRSLCGKLITRPEESYRLWCVVVFSRKKKPREWGGQGPLGGQTRQKKKNVFICGSNNTIIEILA